MPAVFLETMHACPGQEKREALSGCWICGLVDPILDGWVVSVQFRALIVGVLVTNQASASAEVGTAVSAVL